MPTNPRNEGEGNKTADRNYREATKKFVESDRGREQIGPGEPTETLVRRPPPIHSAGDGEVQVIHRYQALSGLGRSGAG